MKHINVEVEDSVYAAAKMAAAESGMMFRKWVERAIAEKSGRVTLPVISDEGIDGAGNWLGPTAQPGLPSVKEMDVEFKRQRGEAFDEGFDTPSVLKSVVATSRPSPNVPMVEDERLGSMTPNLAAVLGVREAPREPDSIARFKKAEKKDGPVSLSERQRQLRNS